MECDLSDLFEMKNGVYVMRSRDGREYPVLYCPLCGTKVDYDFLDEGIENESEQGE